MSTESVTIPGMGVFADGLKSELKRLGLSYGRAAAIAYPGSINAKDKVGKWVRSENEPRVGDAQEFAAAIGTSLTAILLAGIGKDGTWGYLNGVDPQDVMNLVASHPAMRAVIVPDEAVESGQAAIDAAAEGARRSHEEGTQPDPMSPRRKRGGGGSQG